MVLLFVGQISFILVLFNTSNLPSASKVRTLQHEHGPSITAELQAKERERKP
jgi:hypothetical protein